MHRPGLKGAGAVDGRDAKGLLKAAIRDDNPVIDFEHKNPVLLRKGPVPRAMSGADWRRPRFAGKATDVYAPYLRRDGDA